MIALQLFEEEKKASESANKPIIVDSKVTNEFFTKLVHECAVKLELLSIADGKPYLDLSDEDQVLPIPANLHFSSRLPMMGVWMCAPDTPCLYNINNAVAAEVQRQLNVSPPDVGAPVKPDTASHGSESTDGPDVQALWNAVDGFYAVCCMWTLEGSVSLITRSYVNLFLS